MGNLCHKNEEMHYIIEHKDGKKKKIVYFHRQIINAKRFRNNKFDGILDGIEEVCAAKPDKDTYPPVIKKISQL